MVNRGRGGHFQKNHLIFSHKNPVFGLILTLCIFFVFLKELSFIFPYKMRMFFFKYTLKSKDIFFFRENVHLFLKKSCAL